MVVVDVLVKYCGSIECEYLFCIFIVLYLIMVVCDRTYLARADEEHKNYMFYNSIIFSMFREKSNCSAYCINDEITVCFWISAIASFVLVMNELCTK